MIDFKEDYKSTTILVVDDDPATLERITALLAGSGIRIEHTTDGEQGLDLACRLQPGLLLLGTRISGGEGLEICRRLKISNAGKEIPVILLLDKDAAALSIKALEAGAADFLFKPLQEQEVFTRIMARLAVYKNRRDAGGMSSQPDSMAKLRETVNNFEIALPNVPINIRHPTIVDRSL
ncbi:MAG: response regulator [Nitrospinae bacterium]|nr:response regulator [Nitrospinota bacterium]